MRDLTADEKMILRKAHVNMGHLAPEKLAQLLKQQGFRPGMMKAAREFQCPECDACAAQCLAASLGLRPSTHVL